MNDYNTDADSKRSRRPRNSSVCEGREVSEEEAGHPAPTAITPSLPDDADEDDEQGLEADQLDELDDEGEDFYPEEGEETLEMSEEDRSYYFDSEEEATAAFHAQQASTAQRAADDAENAKGFDEQRAEEDVEKEDEPAAEEKRARPQPDGDDEENLPDLPSPDMCNALDEYAEPMLVAAMLVDRELLEAATDTKAPGPLAPIPAIGCDRGEDNPLDLLNYSSQLLIDAARHALGADGELPSPGALRQKVRRRVAHDEVLLENQELEEVIETTRLAEEWADRLLADEGRAWSREAVVAHARHALQFLMGCKSVDVSVRLNVATIRRQAIEAWAQSDQGGGTGLLMRSAADVEVRPVRWMYRGVLAVGKLVILCGVPELGKSTLTYDLAARATTGAPWPGQTRRHPKEPQEPVSVLVVNVEDAAADTIVPRLKAAGADLGRVTLIEGMRAYDEKTNKPIKKGFNLQEGLDKLEALIRKNQQAHHRLLLLDPLSAVLGDDINSHRDADVRKVLAPLSEMAERLDLCVVAVMHLRKSEEGSALNRIGGSIAFGAAARVVWGVIRDPEQEDRILFLPMKNNVSARVDGRAYRIVSSDPDDEDAPSALEWETETLAGRMDDYLDDAARLTPERAEARDWLREMLADGPRPATYLKKEAEKAGIGWDQCKRAKKAVPAKSSQLGVFQGCWYWLVQGDERPPAPLPDVPGESDEQEPDATPT